jgi:bifunctional non-homologous end joining protein LigD
MGLVRRLGLTNETLWVKPKIVCEISFAEWTQDGELRQTMFLGWREDKKANEVLLERQ